GALLPRRGVRPRRWRDDFAELGTDVPGAAPRAPALPRQAPRAPRGRARPAADPWVDAAALAAVPRRAAADVPGSGALAGERPHGGVARMRSPAVVVDVGWVNGLAAIR